MKNFIQLFGTCLNILFISSSICVANESVFKEKECFGENCFSKNDKKTTEDKLYIKPECIYLSQDQIYVIFEDDLIPIHHLSCDNDGFFTSIQDIQMGRSPSHDTWECKKCGYENYVGINFCGLCGNPRYAKYSR